MSSRQKATLDDVCSLIADCPHSTPVWTESGYLVIRNQNIKGGKLDLSERSFTDHTHYLIRIRRAKPQYGDLILTREAPMGEVCMVPHGLECCVGQRQVLLRPNLEKVVPRFLLYAIQSPEVQHEISWSEGTGSTVSNIRIPVLKSIRIPLLPLKQQERIAALLGALDDRIALLRETNATLEAIAQALFKSWFVDFDPVHAKARGEQPEGMPEHLAAVFPDSFEESPLGLVPRGWNFSPIKSKVEGIYDGPHATPPESDTGAIFLGIKNLTGSALDFSDEKYISEVDFVTWTKRVTPRPGDIVFSYEATLGFFALIPENVRCCLGRRLALIRPRVSNGYGHFWFHQLIAPEFQRLLVKHTVQGATVNRIALKEFPSYLVLDPTDDLKAAFDCIAKGLWEKFHANQAQTKILTSLRDTLLPRLISGALRLPEAESAIAEQR